MALPFDIGVLWLAVGLVLAYLLISIGYRRFLFQYLPDPSDRSPDADEPAGPGELHCPRCGAINEVGFEKCQHCAGRLPAETEEL